MYVPKHFAMSERCDQHALIDACDFGVLVSTGMPGLFATHIPMMLARDEGAFGTLYGHVARANPHERLLDGHEALVVFSGPHGYISPSWFSDRTANVPTWNYTAVHCYGTPSPSSSDKFDHLRLMTDRYENGRVNGWSVDELNPVLRDGLPRALTAFRMEITRIEGKAKLSQNKARVERERVIEELKAAGEVKLAMRMQAALEPLVS